MDRPYLFYELTNSLCSKCLRRVEAKVIFQDGCVYLHKHCPEHKFEKVLISTDIDYYKLARNDLKPGQMPLQFNTPIKYGCPYDCGLCPDHEQHSCLSLIEVTDQCNLKCPVCYADSSPQRLSHVLEARIAAGSNRRTGDLRRPLVAQRDQGPARGQSSERWRK